MDHFKEWLAATETKYLEARELIEKTSLQDPHTQPYKSKYAAQTILQNISDELSELNYASSIDSDDPFNQVNLIKLLVRMELGMVAVDTEDTGMGRRFLESAHSFFVETFQNDPRLILIQLNLLNQLGYLWCSFGEHEKAATVLEEAEKSYASWKKTSDIHVIDFIDCFKAQIPTECDKAVCTKVEKSFTQTLYFLAQVYEKLGRNDNAAIYCNMTLKRQFSQSAGKEFDPIDWAINAATLSQYFAVNDMFESARHHLAAAKYVLEHHSCDFGDEDERAKKSKADVARILVKYCLILLDSDKTPPGAPKVTLISDVDLSTIENAIPKDTPSTFEEARKIFLVGQTALNEAKEYYSIDEHASDHVECISDLSKLYNSLTKHEIDKERSCKMHKRRIDMLNHLLREINPTYFLGQTRQILFELGEIHSEMVDLKMSLLEKKSPNELPSAAAKLNTLIKAGISYFSKFVETFKEKSTNALPATFDEDMVKPIIVAFFSIGRLSTKFYTNDPREQAKNWTSCQEYYNKVVAYIENNPSHEQFVTQELNLIEEMLTLIPGKLNLVLNSVMY